MTPDEALQVAVNATVEKLEDDRLGRRRAAIWELYHTHNWSAPAIADNLRDALLSRGYTVAHIRDAGVSYASVRRIVEAPQPTD